MQKIICDFLTLWCESITCLSKRQQQLGYHHISCYTTTTFMLWYHNISCYTTTTFMLWYHHISCYTATTFMLWYHNISCYTTTTFMLWYHNSSCYTTTTFMLWFLKLPGTHVSMINFQKSWKNASIKFLTSGLQKTRLKDGKANCLLNHFHCDWNQTIRVDATV